MIDAEGLEERALVLGERIQNGLREELAGRNDIKEIRGAGLLMAVEMHQGIGGFADKALEQGLLINVTQGNIIRMLPPLTMTDAEADELVSRVVDLIKVSQNSPPTPSEPSNDQERFSFAIGFFV